MENQFNQSYPIVRTRDWMITYLITAIPVVGFIMLFVWAFSGGTNPNKANWAKAALVWMLIGIAFSTFIIMTFGAAIMAAVANS